MTEPDHHVRASRLAALEREIEAARCRELRDFLAITPNPSDYAMRLPGWMAEALRRAVRGSAGVAADCYRLPEDIAPKLRPYGLCEIGGRCLTAFAIAVRRELMKDER